MSDNTLVINDGSLENHGFLKKHLFAGHGSDAPSIMGNLGRRISSMGPKEAI